MLLLKAHSARAYLPYNLVPRLSEQGEEESVVSTASGGSGCIRIHKDNI